MHLLFFSFLLIDNNVLETEREREKIMPSVKTFNGEINVSNRKMIVVGHDYLLSTH